MTWIAAILLSAYALWLFYLAVMNLKRARDTGALSRTALVLGYPVLAIGLLLDLVVNVTLASLLFLEWPRELTVTSRLRRLAVGAGWRRALAAWIADHLLDDFDPSGRHI